jgi:protein-S-isoprenylcysteine O-methyltransferase Ste14
LTARLSGLVAGLVSTAVVAAILFGAAGRLDVPAFWAYVGVWAAAAFVGAAALDPDLIRERLLPGPGARDVGMTALFVPVALAQFVVAGLDVGRFHWSDGVSPALQAIGLVLVAAALGVSIWAASVNPFFSSVIRIQTDRGHRLVTAGPYRVVRHPGYASGPFLLVGTGVALGSWAAAAIGVVLVLLLLRRTAHEDRVLREELPGYAEYAGEVRWRLLPGVW